jgi:hypothetical protein
MIAYGGVAVLLHSCLTSALDEDHSSGSRSAALNQANPNTEWTDMRACLMPLAGTKPQVLPRLAHNVVTIPTELSRFLTSNVGGREGQAAKCVLSVCPSV